MSKKTLAPSVVSHNDPKGRKFMSVVRDAYDGEQLPEEEAQLVNDAPGLGDWIRKWIERHRYLKNSLKWKIQDQVQFYQKHFGITLDTSNLQIPERQDGFDRLIIVVKGITRNQVFSACEKQFPCSRYREDLDNAIRPDGRCAKNGTYAIWVRDLVEADEENKSQSFNKRREQGANDENILDRMVHELKYFDETGEHLDLKNWTLTSSLVAGGGAVRASWRDDGFLIDWDFPGNSHDYLRARSAVSCQPKPSGAKA